MISKTLVRTAANGYRAAFFVFFSPQLFSIQTHFFAEQ